MDPEVGKFHNKEYVYQMDPDQTDSCRINVNYCRIGILTNEVTYIVQCITTSFHRYSQRVYIIRVEGNYLDGN